MQDAAPQNSLEEDANKPAEVRQILSVEHSAKDHKTPAPDFEVGCESVFGATVGVVVGRGSERGSALYGMLASDSGHAYETEGSSRTTAAASVAVLADVAVRTCQGVGSAVSVFVLADMAVRTNEGARSAVEAVQQVELEVDVAREPDVEVPSVSGVVVLGVSVLACANDFEAFGQLVLKQVVSRCSPLCILR